MIEKAKRIMGPNFLGSDEVKSVLGRVLLDMEAPFTHMPFHEDALEECCETHLLVADTGQSLYYVRERLFDRFPGQYGRGHYHGEEFAMHECAPRWRLIRKTPDPDSLGKTTDWHVLDPRDMIPCARELYFAAMVNFFVNKEEILRDHAVRVRDKRVLRNGRNDFRICLGGRPSWQDAGLFVWFEADIETKSDLGIASARVRL